MVFPKQGVLTLLANRNITFTGNEEIALVQRDCFGTAVQDGSESLAL